jgi:trk system potassium uptake protein TrkH
MIFHIVGTLIICIAASMLWPLGISLYYWDAGLGPLLKGFAVSLAAGLILFFAGKSPGSGASITHREGMAATTLGWAAACLAGAIPFYFSGFFPQPVDCIFEAVSGFTTTGASVLKDVEIIPHGLLFWRSLTHWLGGMGIVVLGLAILPFLGVGGMQLYKAEVPGPVVDKLKPRIKETAMILWKVYLAFSVAEAILLLLGGMNLFDSLCHTFGTMATGGFSTKNASIGFYHSAYIDVVVTIFMIIGGINFALHFQLFRGNARPMWRDPEFRFFMGFVGAFILIIAVSVYGKEYASFAQALRYSSFQVSSIVTTTGYATADFKLWPALAQFLLLVCMLVGSCTGSTGGAMKCMRIMVLLKQCYSELIRLIHPRAVVPVKMGRQPVGTEVLRGIFAFVTLYFGILGVSIILVAATGVDLITAITAAMACLGNIGPGLGAVGPADNYAGIPAFAKWVLTLDMLLGRLEIYTMIIIFVPRFYRK